MFAAAAGGTVQVLDPDGEVLAGPPMRGIIPQAQVRVMLDGREIGQIAAGGMAAHPEATRILGLMRDVLSQLCRQSGQLRDHLKELEAMYSLTADFSGKMDPAEVYPLAAETMVKVTGADACSIRQLNDVGTELEVIAAAGLSDEYITKGPILLADSRIDQQVVDTGEVVYIADERSDPRVLYPAEAQREGIVSALVAPMTYRGRIEGIVRVYTRKPHTFDEFEKALIRGVASQAAAAIANARLFAESMDAENMRRQLRLAGEVQRRMIPSSRPKIEGLDIATIYVPCFELGGDFYDFIELPGGNLGVCVADVAGKGVPASLLMASARTALRAHATHMYALSGVLEAVNRHMVASSQEGDFVTLFYGVLDVPNRRLTYCNAGHEPGMLLRDGRLKELSSGGPLVGLDADSRYNHQVVDLLPGDTIVLYTDGLAEAMNFQDEPFGRERIRRAAEAEVSRGGSARSVGRHLLWEMRRFAGLQTRCDDLTLLTVQVL
jgi:sigma-B regulation protein RsbU (phosphoserine phosphatase)